MIISHKHKFIFIKTHKTAGTSLEIALSKYCGEDDVITPISEKDEQIRRNLGYRVAQNYIIPFRNYIFFDWLKYIVTRKKRCFFNHIKARKVKNFVGKRIWSEYYTFCFERNPYDKCISGYYWMKNNNNIPLEKYLLEKAHLFSDFSMYSNKKNKIIMDDVFKYEDINKALNIISQKIGLNEELEISKIRAKGSVRVNKKSYKKLISYDLKKHIDEVFSNELTFFNYKF